MILAETIEFGSSTLSILHVLVNKIEGSALILGVSFIIGCFLLSRRK